MFLLFSCGILPQHWGEIPNNIKSENYGELSNEDTDASEIICAQGERQYYFIGTSRPGLELQFDDEGFQFFNSSYEAVRLKPGKRNFTLRFSYRYIYANFKVKNFQFEPNTKYFAKYSIGGNKVKVWIEKENGSVVYGKKPTEGQF